MLDRPATIPGRLSALGLILLTTIAGAEGRLSINANSSLGIGANRGNHVQGAAVNYGSSQAIGGGDAAAAVLGFGALTILLNESHRAWQQLRQRPTPAETIRSYHPSLPPAAAYRRQVPPLLPLPGRSGRR